MKTAAMEPLWPKSPAIAYISGPPGPEFAIKIRRGLVILGCTGSIGVNALDVVARSPEHFNMLGLACGRNIQLAAAQANRWRPPFLAAATPEAAGALAALLDYHPEIYSGPAGYARLASLDGADCVLCAQSGAAGLPGALAAALAGKTLALANKETLVMAGDLVRKICGKSGASILPVDSEHYALFQCLAGRGNVHSLVITASGGPFHQLPAEKFAGITPEAALRHPNWKMGPKITIDSATLMNKGLEFIEAMRLYGISPDNIEILVHPQSIVHSLVRFLDNSLLAQLAVPDMRLPLAGCLLWPDGSQAFIPPLDLASVGRLTFDKPDIQKFPCLELARKAAEADLRLGGLNQACIALNAANETAVELFIRGKCSFTDIPKIIASVLEQSNFSLPIPEPDMEAGDDIPALALALTETIGGMDARARALARAAASSLRNAWGDPADT